jgi:6-phosphogluconolactonase
LKNAAQITAYCGRSTRVETTVAIELAASCSPFKQSKSSATEAQPRGIRIDPSGQYLVASGEKSGRLSVYKIDQSTGKLGERDRYPVGNGANWVEIVDVQ